MSTTPDAPDKLTRKGTGAAIAVLMISNGDLVTDWSGNTAPGVLLAYTSTLANALLGVAFAEGIVINFWAGALRGVPVGSPHMNSRRDLQVGRYPTFTTTGQVAVLPSGH